MKLINPDSDLHTHSLQFSDGLNTIDELVQMAGRLGLKRLAITDHSDARTYPPVAYRVLLGRYGNVLNDVDVVFGVEGDILNDDGDVCMTIQKSESEFLLLSAHPDTFEGNPEKITGAYLKAFERHHEKIQFVAHPGLYFPHTKMEELTKAANDHGLPLEVNTSHLNAGRLDRAKLEVMVTLADQLVVNSDAHSLADMTLRQHGLDYLREQGIV